MTALPTFTPSGQHTGERLGTLGLVAETLRVTGRRLPLLMTLGIAPAAIYVSVMKYRGDAPTLVMQPFSFALGFPAYWLLALAAGMAVIALVTQVLHITHTEYVPTTGARFRQIACALPAMTIIGTGLVALTSVGLVLFLVPGFYLLGRMAPIMQVILIERRFWGSAARASELTRHHRWPLAGALALLAVLMALLSMAMSAVWVSFVTVLPLAEGNGVGPIQVMILQTASIAIKWVLLGVFTTLVYHRLTLLNASPDVARLTRVFG